MATYEDSSKEYRFILLVGWKGILRFEIVIPRNYLTTFNNSGMGDTLTVRRWVHNKQCLSTWSVNTITDYVTTFCFRKTRACNLYQLSRDDSNGNQIDRARNTKPQVLLTSHQRMCRCHSDTMHIVLVEFGQNNRKYFPMMRQSRPVHHTEGCDAIAHGAV